ncbi:MAG: caspase family protein, partial [Pseudomonadota bacterium]
MRHLTAFVSMLLIAAALPCVQASERHALVIGNSDYLIQPLVNPRNYATDVAAELRNMGYKLHNGGALLDLNRRDIVRALITFADALPNNADVLFYYAGHGMSVGRENFLIPIGHQLEAVEQLPDAAISLRFVLERLKNANPQGTNVVLLDACRDNPLTRSFRSTRAGLSTEQEIPRG